MWDALTWQGKALVVSVLAGVIMIVLLVARRGGSDVPPPQLLISQATIAPISFANATPLPTSPAVQAPAPTVSIPTAAPTTPASTPTREAATATAPVATAPPPPPPPTSTAVPQPTEVPPTAVPAGCAATANVSNTAPPGGSIVTVVGQLTCGSTGVGNVPMKAVVSSSSSQTQCAGVSNAQGFARCDVQASAAGTGATSINVCFSYQGQLVCAQTGFTPR